jgi:hypothetical protein
VAKMIDPSAPLIGIGARSLEGWRRSEKTLVLEKVAPESSCQGISVGISDVPKTDEIIAVVVRE